MRQYCSLLALGFLSIMAVWGSGPEAPGVRNFHQVNDHIYRGGQPTGHGWESLAKIGVKSVIDLRRDGEEGHSLKAEAQAVQALGMRYVSMPMNGLVAPRDEDVRQILRLMDSKDPVFVHCKLGKDRTGTAIGAYRIAREGWQNDKALAEAKAYGLHWFEVGMKRYLDGFQPPVELAVAASDLTPSARP